MKNFVKFLTFLNAFLFYKENSQKKSHLARGIAIVESDFQNFY